MHDRIFTKKTRRGRHKLPITGKDLKEHEKALKKVCAARYHKRLKEGLTANFAAQESRLTRPEDCLVK